ncbi:hypothetical protein VTN49DRAFT_2301 [Thermomyces lanuginosus]|uniref:uncharacterized protein n=1 Tax=Thermomyces lanuginosus TaxID=5541 RepID=UPI00374218E2
MTNAFDSHQVHLRFLVDRQISVSSHARPLISNSSQESNLPSSGLPFVSEKSRLQASIEQRRSYSSPFSSEP